MAIEYKVIERKNPKDITKKKYYASANVVGETSTEQLCRDIEKISTVSGVDVQAVLYALAEVVPQHLAKGKSVHVGQLGHFRITVRSDGKERDTEVGMHSITSARIAFIPTRTFSRVTKDLNYKKKA